jgi:hypothetical protein
MKKHSLNWQNIYLAEQNWQHYVLNVKFVN